MFWKEMNTTEKVEYVVLWLFLIGIMYLTSDIWIEFYHRFTQVF